MSDKFYCSYQKSHCQYNEHATAKGGDDCDEACKYLKEIETLQGPQAPHSNYNGLLAERKMLIRFKCWANGKILQKVGATRKFDKGCKYALEDLIGKIDEALKLATSLDSKPEDQTK